MTNSVALGSFRSKTLCKSSENYTYLSWCPQTMKRDWMEYSLGWHQLSKMKATEENIRYADQILVCSDWVFLLEA